MQDSQPEPHKADLSLQKTLTLLTLLASIWILCYRAELQFPDRHVSDDYGRVGGTGVDGRSVGYAVGVLGEVRRGEGFGGGSAGGVGGSGGGNLNKNSGNGTRNNISTSQSPSIHTLQSQYLTQILKTHNLPTTPQFHKQLPICILLIHKPLPTPTPTRTQNQTQTQILRSVKSILNQQYSNYKLYFVNGYEYGQLIYRYMEDNALGRERVRVLSDIEGSDYVKEFEVGRQYCNNDKDGIVVYMYDYQQIIPQFTFNLLNTLYQSQPRPQILYTSSLTPTPTQSPLTRLLTPNPPQYTLSRSYPYPPQIKASNSYHKYPYLMGGLKTMSAGLLDRVRVEDLRRKDGGLYGRIGGVVVGVGLLRSAGQREGVVYFAEPLVLSQCNNQYITYEEEIKKEIRELSERY